jgi:UDP-N-acetylglucosamine transferase subunit ALG13
MSLERPFVFATVGTDHHPFQRLVDWVDRWAASERALSARCVIQRGPARAPLMAESSPFLSHQELTASLQRASAVVAHAGPGTVMACRSVGIIPVVLPRQRRIGEAVDDHQVRFAARLATRGQLVVAWSAEHLASLLDRAVADPTAFRSPPQDRSLQMVVERFGELVDGLMRSSPPSARSSSGRWTQP